MVVELNSKMLAGVLGAGEDEVERAIEYLSCPDEKSRSRAEDGRRIVRVGEYMYRVVNGVKYRSMRTKENRREYNRIAKRRSRERKRGEIKTRPMRGEVEYVRAFENGAGEDELGRLSDPGKG